MISALASFHGTRRRGVSDDMTGRADWQNLMMRFSTSGFDNRRLFVNVDYIKGAPLKIAVASSIGAVMGVIGGSFGRLTSGRKIAAA